MKESPSLMHDHNFVRNGKDDLHVVFTGGAKYIKALRGPFPHIDFVPTGGVTLETTPEFIHAGATAVAVGSELVDLKALRAGRLDQITANARAFLEAVRAARATPGK